LLRGRRTECATLDRLLDAARVGQSGALVLRGEPGIGKSALLAYALGASSGFRITRASGVESEVELAFAGLHQLCASLLDRRERLPSPQQEALETAFGLSPGAPPDRFFVGLAVLNLLSDTAADQPLLCLIDDAQWLDRESAQALGFVARRLQAESVALVFATRDANQPDELAGLPQVMLEGLSDADAREMLSSVIRARLDERVRDRIVAETRGNPLALLELPRGLTPAELAGGFGLPGGLPLVGRIEESFLHRIQRLPAETQRLLLVGAAEPAGDPALLWRASTRLGIGIEAAAPAEADGLLELGAQVRFRHPLVRSAIYRASSLEERQAVHRALADATDPDVDPDRRAWHRAHAAAEPDEDVAAELERSADRAQSRGGQAAAAAFLERATALTVEPRRRCARALAAAQAKYHAGALGAAQALLATADAGPLDELQAARVELLRAQIAFAVRRGSDAPPLLLEAAKRLEPLDSRLARETYLDAFLAAMFAGRLSSSGDLLRVAAAVRATPRPSHARRGSDLLLEGLAVRITEGYASGVPLLKRALSAFRSADSSGEDDIRWLWLACHTAHDLWDDETFEAISSRYLQIARDAGMLTELPLALIARVYMRLYAGDLSSAALLLEEVEAVIEATGSHLAPYGALELAALQGNEAKTAELIEARMGEVMTRGEGLGLTLVQNATALLCNALGRYGDARDAALTASEHPEELGTSTWTLPELIEAAVRSGTPEPATHALNRLSETTQASRTDWALGIEARSRALLSEGDAAEKLYREAIERLGRTRVRLELSRAHLVYGEWLRRERRATDAREQLRTAHELFETMGAEGFAKRAARELQASGEKARTRTVETRGQLTAQENQIAQLARDGLSNPEIGARLFISPRTVEYHLHKVFTKLDITSRGQLDRVLPIGPRQARPA
jgi:DNA-binding CsgD family transcriptional regulator